MASYRAIILGGIWMPYGALCSLEANFTADTDEEAIEAAQTREAGDFSSVQDVQVMRFADPYLHRFPTIMVKDWENEDNECAYMDTIHEGDEAEEESEDEEDDDDLLEPVRDVTQRGVRIATFEVEVPEDLYSTQRERADHAIYVAQEQASDYVLPASYRARIVTRGYSETYRVVRRSNAIAKEVSQTTAM